MDDEVLTLDDYQELLSAATTALNKLIENDKHRQALAYDMGYIDGLSAYAWWKDGVQYVGSCGTTLVKALKNRPRNSQKTP